MIYVLATVWLLGCYLLAQAAQSEPTLHQCHSCGDVLYARRYLPVWCNACRALNWF